MVKISKLFGCQAAAHHQPHYKPRAHADAGPPLARTPTSPFARSSVARRPRDLAVDRAPNFPARSRVRGHAHRVRVEMSLVPTYKVVLLGEGRVGKTSLLLRYVNDVFNDKQPATIQASYLTKRVNVDGTSTQLAVWDTAGQERFHALGPIYYRDADAALLVYDITDVDSFARVKNWVKELRQMACKDIIIALVGNKIDMERHRRVTDAEANEYAASVGAELFGTSAKADKGVDAAFAGIAKRLHARRAAAVREGRAGVTSRRGGLTIVDEKPGARKQQAQECC